MKHCKHCNRQRGRWMPASPEEWYRIAKEAYQHATCGKTRCLVHHIRGGGRVAYFCTPHRGLAHNPNWYLCKEHRGAFEAVYTEVVLCG